MKTVLFIEDNNEIRENTGEILELANYRVLLAPNGKKGVEVALAEMPDIIVCDITMPELDGYGVLHLLHKNDETRHIPFIFLTAHADRAELRKGMELGADDYITKPFSKSELLKAIEGRLKKNEELQAAYTDRMRILERYVHDSDDRTLKELFEEDRDSRIYQKKERIFREGQRAHRLYYVESGKIKIYKVNEQGKEFIISICRSGEFFGYTALLEGVTYAESAEALEDCEISSISREAFEQFMNRNMAVMRDFVRLIAGNMQQMEFHLLGVAYNSLRKKVAEALITLNKKFKGEDGMDVPIQISRDNLAALAGTAKESLIRTLGEFREEGLISLRGTDILILEEKKLLNLMN